MKKPRAHFPDIPAIAWEGPKTDNPLAFRHYNPDEVIDGKSVSDHLRFSIAYWHAFRGTGSDPFGPGTIERPWERQTYDIGVPVAGHFGTEIDEFRQNLARQGGTVGPA